MPVEQNAAAALSAVGQVVVALDVDDVLNADRNGGARHELLLRAGTLPASPFVRGYGKKDTRITVHLSPAHGAWIRDLLSRGVEVVWASTWEHAANTYLAPLLDIPPLPVAVSVEEHPVRFDYYKRGDSGAWKAEALCARYPDPSTALVWIDDQAGPWRGGALRRSGPSLVVAPRSPDGLTADHIAAVEAWMGRHSVSDDRAAYGSDALDLLGDKIIRVARRAKESGS